MIKGIARDPKGADYSRLQGEIDFSLLVETFVFVQIIPETLVRMPYFCIIMYIKQTKNA